MADIAQVLATGGAALVSAAVGAGLTYWLGALNRRHQEAREDATRWYEKRVQAYKTFLPSRFKDLPYLRKALRKPSMRSMSLT
jgi:hypothetical protein